MFPVPRSPASRRRRHNGPRLTVTAALLVFALVLGGLLARDALGAPVVPAEQRLADASAAWMGEVTGTPVASRPIVAVPFEPSRQIAWAYAGEGARIEVERWLWASWHTWDRGSLYGDPHAIHTLLHELAHRHGSVLEEGVTDAVALDLLAPWSRRFLGTTAFLDGYGLRASDAGYPAEVRQVRALSVAATGRRWRSWEARRWRWALWAADDAGRSAMVAEANGRAGR